VEPPRSRQLHPTTANYAKINFKLFSRVFLHQTTLPRAPPARKPNPKVTPFDILLPAPFCLNCSFCHADGYGTAAGRPTGRVKLHFYPMFMCFRTAGRRDSPRESTCRLRSLHLTLMWYVAARAFLLSWLKNAIFWMNKKQSKSIRNGPSGYLNRSRVASAPGLTRHSLHEAGLGSVTLRDPLRWWDLLDGSAGTSQTPRFSSRHD
jgi:hypothetical protein